MPSYSQNFDTVFTIHIRALYPLKTSGSILGIIVELENSITHFIEYIEFLHSMRKWYT